MRFPCGHHLLSALIFSLFCLLLQRTEQREMSLDGCFLCCGGDQRQSDTKMMSGECLFVGPEKNRNFNVKVGCALRSLRKTAPATLGINLHNAICIYSELSQSMAPEVIGGANEHPNYTCWELGVGLVYKRAEK